MVLLCTIARGTGACETFLRIQYFVSFIEHKIIMNLDKSTNEYPHTSIQEHGRPRSVT